MAGLGFTCLLLALAVCAYGIAASIYGVRSAAARSSPTPAAARCTRSPAVLTIAGLVLELAFLRNDFAFNTVADTSSRTTPALYRVAAVWSSQEGSLLLWAWLLSLWSSLALFLTRRRLREVGRLRDRDPARLGGFFVALMVFYANPFARPTRPPPKAPAWTRCCASRR